ncbi:hypothetical protein FOA52_005652 [Chlamydomonas sp. UWO 241]|nr:hypothetical protein FOA52_005652 [Chlamydomonas sp. UWO 241]
MVQVKVKLLTHALPCGPEVTVDISEHEPLYSVKAKLEVATGVPMEHQKVMLAGIGQMVMADKRSGLGFSHCGSANSLYFGLLSVPTTAPPGAKAAPTAK